jgi:hypothetical protein
MMRVAAVALMVAGVAIPACAQRHSSHGGFSSHSAPAFHSTPAFRGGPPPNRFAAPPRSAGAGIFNAPQGYRGGGSGYAGNRPPYYRPSRYRSVYISPYRTGTYYGYPGWMGAGYVGYPDDFDSSDSAASQYAGDAGDGQAGAGYDQAPEGYGAQSYGQSQPMVIRPPYTSYSMQPQSSNAVDGEDVVTFIFKDGRPPLKIRNYLLTQTTLFVGEGRHRDIPVADLDLAATETVNLDAGVHFHRPDQP